MSLFLIALKGCRSCLSGRVFPILLLFSWSWSRAPAACSFQGSEGVTDEMGPAASYLSICQPGDRGEAPGGAGLQQLFQLQFTLELGAGVSHSLSFSLRHRKILTSQGRQRWKRAVPVIIVLILQSVPEFTARSELVRPFPWAQPDCLSFSCSQ